MVHFHTAPYVPLHIHTTTNTCPGTHDTLNTGSLKVAHMDLRESTHQVSRPGVLVAVTGLPIMAYSLKCSRTVYDLSAGGIIAVILVSTLGAFLLQTGVGLCMAWFMATTADHTGAVDLLPSEPPLHSKGLDDDKITYDLPGTYSSCVNSLLSVFEQLVRLRPG